MVGRLRRKARGAKFLLIVAGKEAFSGDFLSTVEIFFKNLLKLKADVNARVHIH